MIQYPLSTSIQQFQRLENVSSDLMNLFYTTTTESLNAYFPISPCIMSGINNINNNYGQIGTSNVFEFAAGAVRFLNQITVIPGSIIEEFTWAPYAGASITLSGITDGTVYYCVAKLTQIANDSYKVTNTMTILDTAVTASGLNDQNVALFAITSNAGVYTVFLDFNCAYNYGSNNQIQSDFNRSINLGSSSGYNITLADGFSYLYNNGDFISYLLPSSSTLPIGFTVCIKNQNGKISIFGSLITMTSAYSNAYYKCEVGDSGWIIDGQPIPTYSNWATQQYVQNYITTNTQEYYSLLITSTGNWICPANITQIYVTLIGGGGSGGASRTINGNQGNSTTAFGLTALGGGGGLSGSTGGYGGNLNGSAGQNANIASGAFNGVGGGGGATWIAQAGGISSNGLLGGGGGGNAASVGSNSYGGGGGASGQLIFKKLVMVIPGTTYTITIGTGGVSAGGSGSGGAGAVLIEY